jgi:predicted nucleotidyltransferase
VTLPRDAPEEAAVAVPAKDLVQRLATVVGRPGSEIDCAYLFGSVARGESGPLSDIDVGILFSGLTPAARRLDLAAAVGEDLARLAKSAIDVVILNDASPAVRHRIVRDGLLLFAADDRRRVAFESRSIDEYLDFQPVLARYDQRLLERAREGRIGT